MATPLTTRTFGNRRQQASGATGVSPVGGTTASPAEVAGAPWIGGTGVPPARQRAVRQLDGADDVLVERRDAMLFEHAPVGLAQISTDGRFLQVNRRLCDLFGYTRDELLARRIHDLTYQDGQPVAHEPATGLPPRGQARLGFLLRCVRKDGALIWVNLTAGMVCPHNGDPVWGVAVVDDALPATSDSDASRLAYAGIVVDTARLDATWEGQPLALSPKELLLFCYFIRHQGQVVTRARLLRDVWGSQVDDASRTLDAHICRLRRKVAPLADLLMTMGRVGYTLRHDPGAPEGRSVGGSIPSIQSAN